MDIHFFKQIEQEGLLDAESLQGIEQHQAKNTFSVGWELKTLLSLGILLFTSGISVFIYKNIDTIGHLTIIILIVLIMAGCFFYCIKTKAPYSRQKVADPGIWFGYVLVLGALLLLAFVGYVQFQYHLFGTSWGLATFIPAALLFAAAYYFDNVAVLSLAITTFATWIGLSVTPLYLLKNNDFTNDHVIYSGVLFGILLLGVTVFSLRADFKAHFAFTYKNFGVHLLFIALLAAMFTSGNDFPLWFALLALVTVYEFMQSLQLRSFYFLLFTSIYGYIGASYIVAKILVMGDSLGFYLLFIYFIISSVYGILLLARYNKKLHADDRI